MRRQSGFLTDGIPLFAVGFSLAVSLHWGCVMNITMEMAGNICDAVAESLL